VNYNTSQLVIFEVIKDMVIDGTKMRQVTVTQRRKSNVSGRREGV